jgi:ferredoxin
MSDKPLVTVDQERCVSAGRCVADEPTAFGFTDDELAEVLPGATELSVERLIVLARRCPGLAIEVRSASGELLAP